MFAAVVAAHSPLIRNDVAPAAAPPVQSSPQPPLVADDFTVSAIANIGLAVGVPVVAQVIANLAGSGAAPTIQVSGSVPGITFAVAWGSSTGTLTISGTPTAPVGVKRVVITYLAPDKTVRGSSIHEFTVVDPASLLTISAIVHPTGRVAQAMDVAMASISYPVPIDLVANAFANCPGLAVSLTWNKGTPSTGTLRIAGTPIISTALLRGVPEGSANDYRLITTNLCMAGTPGGALGVTLGSVANLLTIGSASTPAAPTPPAQPAQPTPAAPPSSAAAPTQPPRAGADPFWSSVLYVNPLERANDGLPSLSFSGLWSIGAGGVGGSNSAVSGRPASGQAGANIPPGGFIYQEVPLGAPGGGGAAGFTIEAMVSFPEGEPWTETQGAKLYPVLWGTVVRRNDVQALVGLISRVERGRRVVRSAFTLSWGGVGDFVLIGDEIGAGERQTWAHFAGQIKPATGGFELSVWWRGGLAGSLTVAAPGMPSFGSRLVMGGSPSASASPCFAAAACGLGLLTLDIDDVRMTNAPRYASVGSTIPANLLKLPWPLY